MILFYHLLEFILNVQMMRLEKMIDLIEDNHHRISGIGEIGLDPTYVNNDEDTKRQIHVFETLLSSCRKI